MFSFESKFSFLQGHMVSLCITMVSNFSEIPTYYISSCISDIPFPSSIQLLEFQLVNNLLVSNSLSLYKHVYFVFIRERYFHWAQSFKLIYFSILQVLFGYVSNLVGYLLQFSVIPVFFQTPFSFFQNSKARLFVICVL